MVEAGEAGGELGPTLDRSRIPLSRWVLVEPVLILLVAGAVAFVVMALMLPVFDINEVIQ